jgi:hypothetical protein
MAFLQWMTVPYMWDYIRGHFSIPPLHAVQQDDSRERLAATPTGMQLRSASAHPLPSYGPAASPPTPPLRMAVSSAQSPPLLMVVLKSWKKGA